MKQYDIKQLIIRLTAATLVALMLYIGYLVAFCRAEYQYFSLIYPICFMLICFAVNLIEVKGMEEQTRSKIIISIGVAFALAATIFSRGFNGVVSFMLVLLFYVMLWYKATENFYELFEVIYTVSQFKRNLLTLLLINIYAAYFSYAPKTIESIKTYSILYIVVAVFMLFVMRNTKFAKAAQQKQSMIESILAIAFVLATFIMSIPSVYRPVLAAIASGYSLIEAGVQKVFEVIAIPFVYFFNWLFSLVKPGRGRVLEKVLDVLVKGREEYLEDVQEIPEYNPQIVRLVYKIIMAALALCALAVIIYFAYISIDRFVRKKRRIGFSEDKEFVVDLKETGIGRLFANAAGKLAGLYKKAAFSLTASNREKLRHEYKLFLKKAYEKSVIKGENVTSHEVYEQIIIRYPSSLSLMELITQLYEEVRYGTKNPENGELANFRLNISQVSRLF